MPPVLHLILLILSFLLFALAAWEAPSPPNWHRYVAAGLACLVASMISW